MHPSITYPKLRWPLDIRLERIDANNEALVIMCPLGVSSPLALVPAVGPVIGAFDGQISTSEILNRFSQYGLTQALLVQLIDMLDNALFLATPKFFEAQKIMLDNYSASTERHPALAGLSYALSSIDLEKEINSYFELGKTVLRSRNSKMCALVAPHIDYRRGSVCYGITYNHLKQESHDIYILIGTAHQYSRLMFHLTKKHFSTPLGSLSCETEFVHMLATLYGEKRSFEDEILHRKEHSLELQTPFLKKLKGNSRIVPILVGSFYHMLSSGKSPSQFEEYEKFIESLLECFKHFSALGKSICLIAGVDMAHIGKSFGDKDSLSQEKMEQIGLRDKEYLDAIAMQNKEKLFSHIAEDSDARRICGFPTMYTVIDLFDRLGLKYSAEIFNYRQAVDYEKDCAVTFAGLGMYC
jgi:MEMO1 family protein